MSTPLRDSAIPLKIAFIHPDLGIGGAERLVVDAAVGLQNDGHQVKIFTSHCDLNHCFEEVKNGTLKVQVFGDQLPTNVGGKFFIVFANLRQLYLTFKLLLSKEIDKYDLVIVDQLSTCIPFIHMFSSCKVFFYCHFPDQLLAIRTTTLKKLYRAPFDAFEQFTMTSADKVVVNSNFTKSIYRRTFKWIKDSPNVIYPCVNLAAPSIESIDVDLLSHIMGDSEEFYLSINRYERKKNIELAIQGFALSEESTNNSCKLIVCGGYDERVSENVQYLRELQKEADEWKLSHITISYPEYARAKDLEFFDARNAKVIFLTSISSSLKDLLLQKTKMLLYTPAREHFGIVPLEAMKFGKPVLAVTSGGPLETVVSYVPGENENTATGWLRDPVKMVWAKAIDEFTRSTGVDFDKNGKERVRKLFSSEAMTATFEENIEKVVWKKKEVYPWETAVASLFYFSLHMLALLLFPQQSWPYPVLAGTAATVTKNYFWAMYYVLIFFLTSS
ncbi:GDP-Man:Man(1)GlcNAc(2)-PP-dolichol alpha-1,3-mannosyltransferase KNAG_0F01940 [Huiozyma naganishii CBS 8797]|uniref:Alpha-1,3/1,6-mannosyltransferase ALG2 n=1 Tax=Huiozyma naganishii (strain ATCC MYA-139 / BCRC 22969 / CBS 8797 / KCTC 17520 / NBRC 10181 / NCYC 3082 / Yp74L-3) TaxID=1071383 RepID=J7S021_HUIN7|nr:hypothetical protein KNAG_0F01940 [Kazachstania naganishii CBS 8797]CCK70862.1 hypothetical protein KNAG_0F01940 [Kazachstania naganishii CBS 8797]